MNVQDNEPVVIKKAEKKVRPPELGLFNRGEELLIRDAKFVVHNVRRNYLILKIVDAKLKGD